MKPVALFQHSFYAEPGFVTEYFDRKNIPWRLYRIDEAQVPPDDASHFSGLCFLGGSMSVNDGFAWIDAEIRLIHQSDKLNIPVIGHCFGSQLIAKAFGAVVTKNAVKEIGWGWLNVQHGATAEEWLGHTKPRVRSFQWHGDTFDIPDNATAFMTSDFCRNQAFVLRGLHLAMQCHLEMTPELVRKCVVKGRTEVETEIAVNRNPATQSVSEILTDLDARTAEVNATMAAMYERWIRGLKP